MSAYPKPIQRQALRQAQLQFQVTVLSQCFSCFNYMYSTSPVSPSYVCTQP